MRRLVDPARRRPVLVIACLALAVLAVVRIGHLGVFMIDAGRVGHAFEPAHRTLGDPQLDKPWFTTHNCFTAYYYGDELLARDASNIYRLGHYLDLERDGELGGVFTIDPYQYPPHFLLVPRVMRVAGLDFLAARRLWFAIEIALFTAAALTTAFWLGAREPASWLLWPLVMAAPIAAGTLQVGNAHLAVVAMALLALPAFERRWSWLGGLLLGAAIVTKIFPAVLLVYLVARRRWAAVLWTLGAVAVYTLGALVVLGPEPFTSFFEYQVRRLSSGTAFMFARRCIHPLLSNMSFSGVAHKIYRLGVSMDAPFLAMLLGRGSAVAVSVLAVVAGVRERGGDRVTRARRWAGLLVLGQMVSPFLPWLYGNLAVLWLLALMAPRSSRRARWWIGLAAAWVVLAPTVPLRFGPASAAFDLVYTLAALVFIVVLAAAAFAQDGTGAASAPASAAASPSIAAGS